MAPKNLSLRCPATTYLMPPRNRPLFAQSLSVEERKHIAERYPHLAGLSFEPEVILVVGFVKRILDSGPYATSTRNFVPTSNTRLFSTKGQSRGWKKILTVCMTLIHLHNFVRSDQSSTWGGLLALSSNCPVSDVYERQINGYVQWNPVNFSPNSFQVLIISRQIRKPSSYTLQWIHSKTAPYNFQASLFSWKIGW